MQIQQNINKKKNNNNNDNNNNNSNNNNNNKQIVPCVFFLTNQNPNRIFCSCFPFQKQPRVSSTQVVPTYGTLGTAVALQFTQEVPTEKTPIFWKWPSKNIFPKDPGTSWEREHT